MLNADDYRGESQNAYCISEGIEINILFNLKQVHFFPRKTKAGQQYLESRP